MTTHARWIGPAVAGFVLFAAQGAPVFAQVSAINSDKLFLREFNDDPNSNLTTTNTYPSLVSFSDQNVGGPGTGGFANRNVWRFSGDNGASAFKFTNDTFFTASMNLTLTGTPTTPRKEAGFLFDTLGGQGQYILDTDAHEIVAFGGPLPFFAFPATFQSGQTVTMGMTYFLDPTDGKRKIIYTENGVSSPALTFTNLEQGIINNSTLGGYMQVVVDPNNANNGGTATFANISIRGVQPAAVPEPASLALLGLGLVPLGVAARRRRAGAQ